MRPSAAPSASTSKKTLSVTVPPVARIVARRGADARAARAGASRRPGTKASAAARHRSTAANFDSPDR